MDNFLKNFTFLAGKDTIKNSNSIKILGTIIQNDLRLDKTINKLTSELHNRIYNIRTLTPYTHFSTKSKFLNAFVIGKLNYMVPIYSTATKKKLNKLHKIIMTAARAAIGDYCFKKSTHYILGKGKWFDINDLIKFSSLNTIHKILYYKKPISLVSLFKSNEKERKVKTVTTN